MPQPMTVPSTITIKRNFEELPLFWETEHKGGERPPITWRSVRVDGSFEAVYHLFTQGWHITEIAISVDNGQVGAAAQATLLPLVPGAMGGLHDLVYDAILLKYSEDIEEEIEGALLDFEPRRLVA